MKKAILTLSCFVLFSSNSLAVKKTKSDVYKTFLRTGNPFGLLDLYGASNKTPREIAAQKGRWEERERKKNARKAGRKLGPAESYMWWVKQIHKRKAKKIVRKSKK